ncbi:MAG: AraC family transcriptional regulator [Spirochaetales bacterium]|nr:AraC family transcriptional regulator [Spirochaetales bacterium]
MELEREKPGILIRYFGAISVLSYGLYIVVSLLLLHKHREFVKDCYAYRKGEITLIWIILIPLLFAILVLFLVLGEKFFAVDILSLHLAVYLVLSLYLIFFGLRQKAVFPRQEKMLKEESKPVEADILEENLEQIIKLMEEGKLYRNPTLSVYDLAVKTGISRHKISTVLKEKLSVNFYQFVNDYRLKEVCRRIMEDRDNQKNILEHAFDSGFNSKSSFNSLFKMKYDKTPSQYRKSIN